MTICFIALHGSHMGFNISQKKAEVVISAHIQNIFERRGEIWKYIADDE